MHSQGIPLALLPNLPILPPAIGYQHSWQNHLNMASSSSFATFLHSSPTQYCAVVYVMHFGLLRFVGPSAFMCICKISHADTFIVCIPSLTST